MKIGEILKDVIGIPKKRRGHDFHTSASARPEEDVRLQIKYPGEQRNHLMDPGNISIRFPFLIMP